MQINRCIFYPANSSSEIQVISTEHGIILYSMVKHYNEDLRVGWLHKYVQLSFPDATLIPPWCSYHETLPQTMSTCLYFSLHWI